MNCRQHSQMRHGLRAYLPVRVAWWTGVPGRRFRTDHCAESGRATQAAHQLSASSLTLLPCGADWALDVRQRPRNSILTVCAPTSSSPWKRLHQSVAPGCGGRPSRRAVEFGARAKGGRGFVVAEKFDLDGVEEAGGGVD